MLELIPKQNHLTNILVELETNLKYCYNPFLPMNFFFMKVNKYPNWNKKFENPVQNHTQGFMKFLKDNLKTQMKL